MKLPLLKKSRIKIHIGDLNYFFTILNIVLLTIAFGSNAALGQESTSKEQLLKFLYKQQTVDSSTVKSDSPQIPVQRIYQGYDNAFFSAEKFTIKEVELPQSLTAKNMSEAIDAMSNPVDNSALTPTNQALVASMINDSLKPNISMDSIKVSNARDYEQILETYGFYDFLDVTFRVQLGAFKNKNTFNKAPFVKYGQVQSYEMTDAITRYTVGDYSYLRQADDLKKKIRLAGYPDVFVVVFKNGKRQFDFNFEQ